MFRIGSKNRPVQLPPYELTPEERASLNVIIDFVKALSITGVVNDETCEKLRNQVNEYNNTIATICLRIKEYCKNGIEMEIKDLFLIDCATSRISDLENTVTKIEEALRNPVNNLDVLEITPAESITLTREELQTLLDKAYQRGINRGRQDMRDGIVSD